jgi:glutaconyl-CoA/methylmalonyl-CoA decarboxylase subunit delta
MDKLLFGLSVMLIGLLVVFAGLILLIGCIKLISLLSGGGRKEEPAAEPEADAAMEEALPEPEFPQGLTLETVAAITAAIAAVWQGDTGFVVRRVRRVHNAAAWNLAGREEQVYSRM